MPSLRDIRTRIASVKSTRQITSAMKMVAAAKLRRATESAMNARPYQETLTRTLRRVAAAANDVENPLLEARPQVKTVLVVVIGSDRGLCGGYNANRDRKIDEFIRKQKADGHQVLLRTYGKKPRDFFKIRGFPGATDAHIEVKPNLFSEKVQELSAFLTAGFTGGEFDEAWLCFNQFKSTLTQVPTLSKVLPLSIEAGGDKDAGGVDYKYEPDGKTILGALLPLYLRTLLFQAFLENEAGEQAARMTAMDSATRNASDLIDRLTLEYNRSRQAAITKELIEIISGAEAL
jgi:F-type H+-transporting ATPase subunit gamma